MLNTSYEPTEIESKWLSRWKEGHYWHANTLARDQPKFSMVIPPPNVTGTLHLGHTMMAAIQDTICRYHRMNGRDVCWVPGTDHAGIATQSVVEKRLLREENKTRHDFTREEFLEKVWEWRERNGSRILQQFRELGTSPDWDREYFTMSPELSSSVTEAFVRLYEEGLIYRAYRLVSWSPFLNTAISDIEVDTDEFTTPDRIRIPGYEKTVEVGLLWTFKYQIKGSDEMIEVATSRPETMLGDVAVAVHPQDDRYRKFVGKELVHPFIPDRHMIVVADEHCDPEFGTGAVKITPAHDKNDYDLGQRHNLPSINIFTLDGKVNSNGGDFAGLHRFDARVQIEKRLRDLGLFVSKDKNPRKMAIPRCSRSGDIIEYMLVSQWYVNCDSMAKKSVDAVKNGELTILPAGNDRTWYHWLDNIRDWCISRQLWWGHRIPAYRVVSVDDKAVDGDEIWIIARSNESAAEKAKEKYGPNVVIEQDNDVLDTWFSSGLLPFSVFNWPRESSELSRYFPTDLLETGSDILFFWVARMVMLSLELTDKLPFRTVLLHPMVRDAHGKKMSKSLGNVIDPSDVIRGISLETLCEQVRSSNLKEAEIKRAIEAHKKDFPNGIDECGADALRYGLLSYLRGGKDINLDIKRIISYRHFCNKLWNATKFCFSVIKSKPDVFICPNVCPQNVSHWSDRWILSRLRVAIAATVAGIEEYAFYSAVNATHSFFVSEFCDIYIELSKGRGDEAAHVLAYVIDTVMRLLHPMMPFVTEELWAGLYETCGVRQPAPALMVAAFPVLTDAPDRDEAIEAAMAVFMSTVRTFRSMLAQYEVKPSARLNGYIMGETLAGYELDLASLAKLKAVIIVKEMPPNVVKDITPESIVVGLDPAGQIEFSKVKSKLDKKLRLVSDSLDKIYKKLAAPDFIAKVPEAVRISTESAKNTYEAEMREVQDALDSISMFL